MASYSHLLRTTPIPPHSVPHPAPAGRPFGKGKRPLGDPVSLPKPHPRFIPPPPPTRKYLTLPLDVIAPNEAKAAADTKSLVFHAVGDSGGIHGDDVQKAIAVAMNSQIEAGKPAAAFYYILGDCVYFNGESGFYNNQFYEPYQGYHAPIFAIPGNHDGDTQVRAGDPPDPESSLYGFMRNFCAPVSHFESPYRATMTQPYVYWVLDTPVVTIIGLYSNVDGTLDARGTTEQQQWLQDQFIGADKNKPLIVTAHHPPYSLDTVHGGYPEIELALDRTIHATGRIPTAVLAGHVHSYQRFERNLDGAKVPYIVAGAGGYANRPGLMHKIETRANGRPLPTGFQTTHPDLKLMAYNDQEPGFLRIAVDGKKGSVRFDYFLVDFDGSFSGKVADSVTAS